MGRQEGRPGVLPRLHFAFLCFGFISILWAVPVFRANRWHYVAYVPCAVTTVCLAIADRRGFVRMLSDGWPVLLYFGYLPVTSFWAEYPETTLWYSAIQLLYLLIFF